jgi:hypothetical protein
MDLFDTTLKPEYNQIFFASGTSWQIWNKPKNAKMIYLIALGSGAGGGRGRSSTAGVTRNGGSGGGSGSIAHLLIPSNKVPDRLYIQVAEGGAGAPALTGTSADAVLSGAAALSYISAEPITTLALNLLLVSGAAAATGLTGATIATQAQALLSYGGIFDSVAGVSGGAGGISGTTNAPYISFTTNIVTGGAGGGGMSSVNIPSTAGGINAFSNITPLIAPGTNGTTTNPGLPGSSGYTTRAYISNLMNSNTPMLFTGGAGGGSSASGVGGPGGHAMFGCGGGGSGAGGTGSDAGGNGGDGLVIITCI